MGFHVAYGAVEYDSFLSCDWLPYIVQYACGHDDLLISLELDTQSTVPRIPLTSVELFNTSSIMYGWDVEVFF